MSGNTDTDSELRAEGEIKPGEESDFSKSELEIMAHHQRELIGMIARENAELSDQRFWGWIQGAALGAAIASLIMSWFGTQGHIAVLVLIFTVVLISFVRLRKKARDRRDENSSLEINFRRQVNESDIEFDRGE